MAKEAGVKERISKEEAFQMYRHMLLIRNFEERAAGMYMLGKIRGFLHLYIGEEAIAAGVMSVLRPDDYLVTHYRDHGHALAKGMDPKVVMAELFGKATGSSKGKGGSMHLFDVEKGLYGGYAIVGGQLPIAVGIALSIKYQKKDQVAVCFLGDGAVNQGEFHESLNLASIWRLPVLFFLENNFYGMGSHVTTTHSGGKDVYLATSHYNIPSRQIDGMDVLKVREATREAVDLVRSEKAPYFLEAICYRFRGHSMADPSEYRKSHEVEDWRGKDPLVTFREFIEAEGLLTRDRLKSLEDEVEEEVEEAIQFADESPEPPLEHLTQDIYA